MRWYQIINEAEDPQQPVVSETMVQAFRKQVYGKYPGMIDTLLLHPFSYGLALLKFQIYRRDENGQPIRNTGVGSMIMQDLTKFADQNYIRLILNLANKNDHTTSRGRLVTFYERFGFVENKGRAKDLSLSWEMYRDPR